MKDREGLIKKLSALRDKSLGTDNPIEAEAFAAKLAALMDKYGVEESDLRSSMNRGPEIGSFSFHAKYINGWRMTLCDQIARTFGCYVSFNKIHERITVWGTEERAEAVKFSYEHVHDQVVKYARVLFPGDRKSQRRAETGLALGTAEKIMNSRQAVVPNGQQLVTRDREAAYEYMQNSGMLVREVDDRSQVTPEGMVGYNASSAIKFREEIGDE